MNKNTKIKNVLLCNPSINIELGRKLYIKITEEIQAEVKEITEQDCIDYMIQLVIDKTYDGFLREKSVVNDGLAKIFTDIVFEGSDPELDHACDVDYIAKVGNKAFGIQIKPVTANANFGNYSATERMKSSFAEFQEKFGGRVFVVFSFDGEIANKGIIKDIQNEIKRLTTQNGKLIRRI